MKNIYKRLSGFLSACAIVAMAGMTACTSDFESINTDPNGIDVSLVKLTSRFNQPIVGVYENYKNSNWEFQLQQNLNADMYSGYMATGTAFNGGQNNGNYAMVDGWNSEPFKAGMLYVMKPISLILQATDAQDYTAIAKIIRVEAMHRVTDVYGPIPYSQAMQGGVAVPYDSQEQLYTAFLQELEEAVNDLTSFVDAGEANSGRLSDFDVVCGADHKQWIRFANTLRLRLAMRISVVKPDLAKSTAEAAVSHKYGVLMVGNPNVEVSDPAIQSPLQEVVIGYGDNRASASLVSILQGYDDPRLPIYVAPVGWLDGKDISKSDGSLAGKLGEYIGIRQGANVDKAFYQYYSTVNLNPKERMSNYKGGGQYISNALPWMKVAEAYFLRAEGALRGWNMGGTAKALYEEGIKVSFDEYGIPAEKYAAYIENNTGVGADYEDPYNSANNIKGVDKCTVKWDEGASNEEKLHKIINQKWLAMYPEGQEAWSELRRTGYPKVFYPAQNFSAGAWAIPNGEFIKRLPFPKSDRDNNEAEVEKAGALLGGPDSPATRLWWDTGRNF